MQRLPSAVSFADAWDSARHEDEQRELLFRAVALVAAQHRAGIKQDDMHRENLMVCGSEVEVIDGASVDTRHQGTPLAMGPSLENLALFFTFLPRSQYHLVDETLAVYAVMRGWEHVGSLKPMLHAKIRRQVERKLRPWLQKVFRESTPFVCRRSWRRALVCRRPDYTPEMKNFLRDPDAAISAGSRIKSGRTATLALVELNGRRMVVKRYNMKNLRHRLKRCLRTTRAAISWRNAHLLDYLGIATPRAVAMFERRWGPLRSTSYFVTEYEPGCDVHTLLHDARADRDSARRMARLFAALMQEFSLYRISHGDMKATNFIAREDRIWTLDLDAMRRHRWQNGFRRAFRKDLQRLNDNWGDLPDAADVFRRHMSDLAP